VSERPDLFRFCHDDELAGHPGGKETLRAIGTRFYWASMRKDVRRHVEGGRACTETKAARPLAQGRFQPRQPDNPWDVVALDLMGPYSRTPREKRFLLVAMDLFSRWTEAFPVPNTTIGVIAPLLEYEVFARWAYPRAILTDNARSSAARDGRPHATDGAPRFEPHRLIVFRRTAPCVEIRS
jgi:hypothetical protein